jgi:hypothetical protein
VDGNNADSEVDEVWLVEAHQACHNEQDQCKCNRALRPHIFGLVSLLGECVIDASREVVFNFLNFNSFLEVDLVEEQLLFFYRHLLHDLTLLDEQEKGHERVLLCLELLAGHVQLNLCLPDDTSELVKKVFQQVNL